MKNAAINFYHFWYKFIFGGDAAIALTVLWGILAVYSLSTMSINTGWFVLPVIIGVLLIRSLRSALPPQTPQKKKPRKDTTRILTLWLLVVLIIVVPYDIYYVRQVGINPFAVTTMVSPSLFLSYAQQTGIGLFAFNAILPDLILIDVALVIALPMAILSRNRPVLTALCGCLATLLVVQHGVSYALRLAAIASTLAVHSTLFVWLFAAFSVAFVATLPNVCK